MCEDGIEKSIACDHRLSYSTNLMMANSDPRDRFFYPTLILVMDSYNIITCTVINYLTNNDGSIYTYDELKATNNVTINFLQYSGLVRSILAWKKTLNLANIGIKR